MLGFGAIGQFALGEVGTAPTATPDTRPTAWQEPRQAIARKAVVGATIAFISAGVFAPPRASVQNFPPPTGTLRFTVAIPSQFASSIATLAATSSQPYPPWAEPRRSKLWPLQTAQNFSVYGVAASVSNFSQWYANLSEPQRQRIGLKSWLQMTTALASTPATITGVMAATETNADQAEFVYIVARAVASAKVSIIEGPLAAAAASLRES